MISKPLYFFTWRPSPKGRRYAVSVRGSVPEALAMPKALGDLAVR
ncbi:hypothetical protein [Nodularia sphaerocarpa]|nr:hypothetical protein [Nodularia sphaerocarpa]MDB9374075.1 hypothetical protein [Nodularia sphaerocarpa CS-585]MDB9378312.1 hypothetical protein [Nodularia sphaerocarpa CS-585A2]